MTEQDEADLRRLIIEDWQRQQRATEFYASACDGKAKFSSPGMVMKSSIYRRVIHGGVTPYRCIFCGHWHIGAVSPEKKRKKMRIIGASAG